MNTYNNDNNSRTMSALDAYVSSVMRVVYTKMFLALLVTAAASWFVVSNEAVTQMILGGKLSYWVLAFVEIGLVIAITSAINRISQTTATLLFYLFAVVNGLTLSVIFFAYTMQSIAFTFLIAAGVFAAMSIYGYFTKNDLTRMGSFLFMALIGLIIATVVNIFMHSTMLYYIVSFAGVAIFIGLTAWDTQKIKQMAAMTPGESVSKLATIGALSLYLDFINLFLYLLRFFGNSRD
ncbi:MAG: Bax inhibitor-1/YccA family protein [Muribaculaceae bacterium]|nr:Bax inhibitor-1/YccA family protein [Muribaculaceae bacterium]